MKWIGPYVLPWVMRIFYTKSPEKKTLFVQVAGSL